MNTNNPNQNNQAISTQDFYMNEVVKEMDKTLEYMKMRFDDFLTFQNWKTHLKTIDNGMDCDVYGVKEKGRQLYVYMLVPIKNEHRLSEEQWELVYAKMLAPIGQLIIDYTAYPNSEYALAYPKGEDIREIRMSDLTLPLSKLGIKVYSISSNDIEEILPDDFED